MLDILRFRGFLDMATMDDRLNQLMNLMVDDWKAKKIKE